MRTPVAVNSARMLHKPPGFLWVVILGIVGFSVGFIGPMIFLPDSNLGPIIGVLFTGPGGAALGIVMVLLTKAVRLTAAAQWRILCGIVG